MNIGIVGTGNVGGTLGIQLAKAGYHITFGERESGSSQVDQLLKSAPAAGRALLGELSDQVDAIILATPWTPVRDVLQTLGRLDNKILVDATNPILMGGPEELGQGLLIGHTTSAAEEIAKWAPGAKVVKCFNTIGAPNLAQPEFNGQKATMFLCGDDPAAKAAVSKMAADIGFESEDAGALKIARLLEPLAMLWIHLAVGAGWGIDFAFKALRRGSVKA